MSKILSLLGCFVILTLQLMVAQPATSNSDSLLGLLNKTDKKQKAALYNQIAQSYLPGNPKSCIIYAEKALKASDGNLNREQKAFSYKNLGSAYYNLYQFDQALTDYANAKDLFSDIGNKSQVASVMINIGLVYREKNNYEEAIRIFLKSLEIYQSLNDLAGIATVQNMMGSLARRQGNLNLALENYNNALKTRKALNNPDDIAASLSNVALIHKELGQSDTAISFYLKVLEIRNKRNNKIQTANTLNEIGNVYWDKHDYEKALEYYYRSIKIRYQTGDNNEIANSYQNIGNLFSKLGNIDKARDYYLQALNMYMIGDDKRKLASLLTVLGNLEFSAHAYQDALGYFSHALDYRNKIGEKKDIAASLNSLANVYSELNKSSEAEKYFNQALSIRKEVKDVNGQIVTLNDLGNLYEKSGNTIKAQLYFEMVYKIAKESGNSYYISLCARKIAENQIKQNQPEKAFALLTISHESGEKLKNSELHKFVHYALYEHYNQLKDYHNALLNFQVYSQIKDSIQTAQNSLKMLSIQQNLELEKKNNDLKVIENEVNTLRQKNDLQSIAYIKQRFILIFLLVLIVSLLTIGILLNNRYRTRKRHNHELQLQYAELEKKNDLLIKSEADLSKLNSLKDKYFAIIAHDIRNPLSALLSFTNLIQLKYDSLKESEIKEFNALIYKSATNLNNLLENLLSWARANTNRLRYNPIPIRLFTAVENIVSLNELNASQKNITIDCKISDKIEVQADFQMLAIILRNLISNAIKYTNPGGVVTIQAIEVLTHVEILVSDTGVGIDSADISKLFRIDSNYSTYGTGQEPGTGLGLVLVKEFVEKNKGRVFVSSVLGKGTTFTFTLPI